MKRMYIIFGLIPLLHLLASCATVPPMQTASGRPEVTITGVDKKQIINTIANDFVNAGCQIRSMNDFSIVVGRESQNLAANLLLGSKYDPTVEERTSFQLLDTQGGVRVLGNISFITNPGSAFEKPVDLSTGKGGTEVQGYLERLRASFAGNASEPNQPNISSGTPANKPIFGIHLIDAPSSLTKKQGVLIVLVDHGSAAEACGIKVGDILYEFAGLPITCISDCQSAIAKSKMSGQQIVPLKVYRGEQSVDLTAQF